MLAVARRNPRFARLWLAQVVSQAGDWLNRVAILALLGSLGDSGPAAAGLGLLFAIELTVRMVPYAMLGPIAGSVADRLPRRALMIAADLVRAVVVLGFLLVHDSEHVPLAYALLIALTGVSIFFDAARSASVPNTLPPEDLHEAYSLTAATWSLMLAVGAVVGGLLVKMVGVRWVFAIDSLTFIASAVILTGLRLPPVPEHPETFRLRDVVLLTELRRALDHVRRLGIAPLLGTKSFWGAAGGYLVILSIAGRERFAHEPTDPAAAMAAAGLATGLLYAARGVGTGIGPIAARRLFGSTEAALVRQIGIGFVVAACGYAAFALVSSLPASMALVALAHTGGSVVWVASTTFWQRRVDDAYRGRVFTLEFFGLTLSIAIHGLLTGVLYDLTGSLRLTTIALSLVLLAMGGAWWLLTRPVAVDS